MNEIKYRDGLTKVVADAICGDRPRYSPDRACVAHGMQAEVAADALLASPVLAQMKREWQAEAWRDSRLDLAHELRESGAWSEVRMAEWVEMRADRTSLRAEASGQEGT